MAYVYDQYSGKYVLTPDEDLFAAQMAPPQQPLWEAYQPPPEFTYQPPQVSYLQAKPSLVPGLAAPPQPPNLAYQPKFQPSLVGELQAMPMTGADIAAPNLAGRSEQAVAHEALQDRFTADQKAKMARGARLAGEGAASALPFAAQAAALYAPTTGSKYADEQLAELRKEKLKGWNLSAGDKAVFDAGRANISANADAQTRANLAQNLMSRGRSAADHIALMRENARAVVGGNVKMVAAEAQARARNAAAKLKEFEGLIAFKDARERQRRNYLAQSLGAMGGIVGQTLEAQGVRDNAIAGLDPETAEWMVDPANEDALNQMIQLAKTFTPTV